MGTEADPAQLYDKLEALFKKEIKDLDKKMKDSFSTSETNVKKEISDMNKKMKDTVNRSEGKTAEALKKMENSIGELEGKIKNRMQENEEKIKKIINTSMENFQKDMENVVKKQKETEDKQEKMSKELDETRAKVEDLQQYTRNRNIEIHGLPEHQGENLRNIMKTIGEKVGVQMEDYHVDVIHRVRTRNQDKSSPVVVQMTTRTMRDAIIEKARPLEITPQLLGIGGENNKRRLFINEQLTPFKKNLFYHARLLKKNKQYEYVWMRNGRIMAKKNGNSGTTFINSMEDIEKLNN